MATAGIASAQRGSKRFWLSILGGLACLGIGGTIVWSSAAVPQDAAEHRGWADGQALLYEAGIRWSKGASGAKYAMTVRYRLNVGGREYEGTEIGNKHQSKSATEVRSLLVPFAAEASEFSLQDLGPLSPERTWSVAYLPVMVRYDPSNPSRSHMLLSDPLSASGGWLTNGIGWVLVLAGAALIACAWRASVPRDIKQAGS